MLFGKPREFLGEFVCDGAFRLGEFHSCRCEFFDRGSDNSISIMFPFTASVCASFGQPYAQIIVLVSRSEKIRNEGDPLNPPSVVAGVALNCLKRKVLETPLCVRSAVAFKPEPEPRLGLGWVVASAHVFAPLLILKQATDLHTSSLDQRA